MIYFNVLLQWLYLVHFLALEFLILKAPDVALAEAAVGAILTPVIFIITLNKG